jgi:hypothetical protein
MSVVRVASRVARNTARCGSRVPRRRAARRRPPLCEEGDERLEMSHRAERVEIQPLMLQRMPPGFDDRFRVGDLDLREHAAELLGRERGVDRAIDRLLLA